MPQVIGVKFRTTPRIYYFAPNPDEEYKKGDVVVVETQRGVELATVALPVSDVEEKDVVAPLKPIMRLATDADLEAERADREKKRELIATAKEKVAARGLDMKIVDCEFTVDHSKLVLYFTAEQRVDFRDLVRDLASAFHIRIDLRQIGAREECKLIGSLGPCGLPCCCGRFESDSEHVSIKMAKNQNLALTPGKINGMCGRLLCCLAYENATYEDVAKRAPKHGVWVTAPDGRRGVVMSVTPLTETVRLRFGDDDNFEYADFALSELTFDKAHPERPDPPAQKQGQGGKGGKQDRRERQGDGRSDRQGDARRDGKPDRQSDDRRDNDRRDRSKKRNDRPVGEGDGDNGGEKRAEGDRKGGRRDRNKRRRDRRDRDGAPSDRPPEKAPDAPGE